jgi:hypothetical protein
MDEAPTAALREKRQQQQHYVSLSPIPINRVGLVLSIALAFINRKITHMAPAAWKTSFIAEPNPA